MGFRKTEKGNVIYDFDFVPAKLVPLVGMDAERCRYPYGVEDANGNMAPIVLRYQQDRHCRLGIVFAEDDGRLVPITNIQVIAAFCKLFLESGGDCAPSARKFNPEQTDALAARGCKFDIPSKDNAIAFMKDNNLPQDGWSYVGSVAS